MATWIEKARSPEYSPAKLSQMLAGLEYAIGLDELDAAMAHETIIAGGYLNTHLIKAKSIIAEQLDVDRLSSIVADTGYLRVGDGAVTIDGENNRIQANHTDGSYTRMSSEGFLRYASGTNFSYNYLLYVGEVVIPMVDVSQNPVVIQLPSEFAGKDFKVFASLKTFNLPIARLFRSIYVDAYKNSEAGNRHISISAMLTSIEVNTTFGWLKTSVVPEEFKSDWYLSSTFDFITQGGEVTIQYIVIA